jgi:hypothetical protein
MGLASQIIIVYCVFGAIFSIYLAASDKKHGLGLVADVASFHVVGMMLFVLLWPLWALLVYCTDEKKNVRMDVENGTKPIQKPTKNDSRTGGE